MWVTSVGSLLLIDAPNINLYPILVKFSSLSIFLSAFLTIENYGTKKTLSVRAFFKSARKKKVHARLSAYSTIPRNESRAMFVDTHCHIDLMIKSSENKPSLTDLQNIQTLVTESAAAHVTRLITIGTNATDSVFGVHAARTTPEISATVGLHPHEYHAAWRDDIQLFKSMLEQPETYPIVGIGECGLDQSRSKETLPQQRDLFRAQIELALTFKLPLIIHSRDAADETFACLDEYKGEPLFGIMHCYSYGADYAEEACKRNFKLGIGGTVTYPKNHILRDIVTSRSLQDIVLETDAPFLPPQPWRGQQNHPKYIAYIAQYIADLRTTTLAEVATVTTATAKKLFSRS